MHHKCMVSWVYDPRRLFVYINYIITIKVDWKNLHFYLLYLIIATFYFKLKFTSYRNELCNTYIHIHSSSYFLFNYYPRPLVYILLLGWLSCKKNFMLYNYHFKVNLCKIFDHEYVCLLIRLSLIAYQF